VAKRRATGDSAPGWEAIDAALNTVYKGREPQHFATLIKWRLGGPDPLDGISAYANDDPPHWHLVGYGLTELYGKESDDKDVSGWGFELTFRVARPAKEDRPPAWPMNLMQNLARYVFQSGNPFGEGHHLNANSPLALGADTKLRAVAFAEDPALKPRKSRHGRFSFLQIVGLTLDELDAIQAWSATKFLAAMAKRSPLLVTDLARGSLLEDRAFAEAVRKGTERDGSSMGGIFVAQLAAGRQGKEVVLTIGANAVGGLVRMLRGRTLHKREFEVSGREAMAHVVPGKGCSAKVARGAVELTLTEAGARAMLDLPAKRGTYRWDAVPGFAIEVVPTEIRNDEGKVVEVVG
jgi:hypothetical protein